MKSILKILFIGSIFISSFLGYGSGNSPPVSEEIKHQIQKESYFPVIRETGKGKVETKMQVGSITEAHTALKLEPGKSCVAKFNSCSRRDSILFRIVIPDDLEGHKYDFNVKSGDMIIHRRSGKTRGYGVRSFFMMMPEIASLENGKKRNLSIINKSSEPLYIKEVLLLPRFKSWLRKPFTKDDFILSLLVNKNREQHFEMASRLIDAPCVTKAFSTEIYYAARGKNQLVKQAETIKKRCEQYKLGFVAIPCCWWAGTPPEVKQRLDFQQICYSETDDYDDGEGLKNLLGEKWDIRYGLTIPNMWSSTPWQTMNNPELNKMRHVRLKSAIDVLKQTLKDQMLCMVSENEPAYWAFEESDGKYPVRRIPLWADFNPYTVSDAKKEGVNLDPTDGLDITERLWLQQNLARYIRDTIGVIKGAEPEAALYTHALLDYSHFPLFGTGRARPYAEVARVKGARLGVEMLWKTDMDALWRIREWGRWANVNREEYDGFSYSYHVATLQACYIMGADMLNSYNWDSMNREGDPIRYFNEFLKNTASGGDFIISEKNEGNQWYPLEEWHSQVLKNEAFPWFNQVDLNFRCMKMDSRIRLWVSVGREGAVVAFRNLDASDFAWNGSTVIELGDIGQLKQSDSVYLHFKADKGWEYCGGMKGPNMKLICNLFHERRRSRFLIERPSEVRTISLTPDFTDSLIFQEEGKMIKKKSGKK